MKIKIGLLTMSLVLIMGQVAYLASEDIGQEDLRSAGEILYDYGLISGMADGDLGLETPLTRAQACVLLAELNGVKTEAMQSRYEPYFDDVESTAWYAPYVVYAKVNEWIGGYPDGSFKPEASISSKEWASMLMKILDYPYTWDNLEDKIDELGINYLAEWQDAFKRGEAFELLWQVLRIPSRGDTETLGVRLGYLAPLEIHTQASLEVVGYITPSLRTISVKFASSLLYESAVELSHYKLTDVKGGLIAIEAIRYSEENDEVTLILSEPRSTYDLLKLEISNLTLYTGESVSHVIINPIEMIDIVNPEVVKIYRLEDEEQVHIVFSEPVVPLKINDVYHDADKGSIQSIEMLNADQEALLTFETVPTALVTLTLKNTVSDDYGHHIETRAYPITIETPETEELITEEVDAPATTEETPLSHEGNRPLDEEANFDLEEQSENENTDLINIEGVE